MIIGALFCIIHSYFQKKKKKKKAKELNGNNFSLLYFFPL